MLAPVHPYLAALTLLIAIITPTTAAADPITEFKPLLVGDGYILHGGHTITLDDLAALAGRTDNGWHLGWFKRKLRDGGGLDGSAPDPSWGPIWSPGVGGGSAGLTIPPGAPFEPGWPAAGLPPQAGGGLGQTQTHPAAIVTPEPGSLVLLGTGLLVIGRRLRRRSAAPAQN